MIDVPLSTVIVLAVAVGLFSTILLGGLEYLVQGKITWQLVLILDGALAAYATLVVYTDHNFWIGWAYLATVAFPIILYVWIGRICRPQP